MRTSYPDSLPKRKSIFTPMRTILNQKCPKSFNPRTIKIRKFRISNFPVRRFNSIKIHHKILPSLLQTNELSLILPEILSIRILCPRDKKKGVNKLDRKTISKQFMKSPGIHKLTILRKNQWNPRLRWHNNWIQDPDDIMRRLKLREHLWNKKNQFKATTNVISSTILAIKDCLKNIISTSANLVPGLDLFPKKRYLSRRPLKTKISQPTIIFPTANTTRMDSTTKTLFLEEESHTMTTSRLKVVITLLWTKPMAILLKPIFPNPKN